MSCDNGDGTDAWSEQHLDQQLEQEPEELVRYVVTYPSAPSKRPWVPAAQVPKFGDGQLPGGGA